MSETNLINSQDDQDGKQILDSIFKKLNNNTNKYFPILEDSTNISNLILFLKDKNNNVNQKIEILYTLLEIFKTNNLLLPLFMKKNVTNIINFYEPLIDLYLSENEHRQLIENIIKMIRKDITLTKAPIEYLYEKLSYYYDNKEISENERLNENQILKYLNLLKIFYIGVNEINIFQKSQLSFSTMDDVPNVK